MKDFLKYHVSRKSRYRNHTVFPHIKWFLEGIISFFYLMKSRYRETFIHQKFYHVIRNHVKWGIAVYIHIGIHLICLDVIKHQIKIADVAWSWNMVLQFRKFRILHTTSLYLKQLLKLLQYIRVSSKFGKNSIYLCFWKIVSITQMYGMTLWDKVYYSSDPKKFCI